MSFEMIVALELSDKKGYQNYRDGMTPLLEAVGGGFRYDFEVSKVLKGEVKHGLNRVFAIHFPDRATRDKFFTSEKYNNVRSQFYEKAVANRTIIAEYERP